MSRVCKLTGKRTRSANNVSHAKNRTKRKQRPNIIKKKVYIPSLGRSATIKISTKALKAISLNGIEAVMKKAKCLPKEIIVNN